MNLVKLSKEYLMSGQTTIDNDFIANYLPFAPDNAVKIYLYGLLIAGKDGDNSLDSVALDLNLQQNDVVSLYDYWRDLGLVRINCTSPLQVEYLPINSGNSKIRKYKPEKYEQFTKDLQNIFVETPLTPNKFLQFIEIIEYYKIQPDALLMIVGYCVKIKGERVHINYILTVAKAWAKEGLFTAKAVDDKLQEIEISSDKIREVLYALKIKKPAELEDKQAYLKWTDSWGYEHASILYTAEKVVKRGSINKLDSTLDNFYRNGIFNLKDIEGQATYMANSRDLAIKVVKNIGVYYENIDPVIDVYISDWIQKGFDNNAIIQISVYCFKRGIRSLDAMNNYMEKFYDKGLLTFDHIMDFINKAMRIDKEIKSVIELTGSTRRVMDSDRKYYNTWSSLWGFNNEMINYAAGLSAVKSHPFAYINVVLAKWLKDGIDNVEKASSLAAIMPNTNKDNNDKNKAQHFKAERDYSDPETLANDSIDDLADIESFLSSL